MHASTAAAAAPFSHCRCCRPFNRSTNNATAALHSADKQTVGHGQQEAVAEKGQKKGRRLAKSAPLLSGRVGRSASPEPLQSPPSSTAAPTLCH
uniref:HDC14849 n=1 Tax=Drosophila melanogaster TaxID=7227 RepID=Q6IJI8_DROME|nr:TPA_inf: HDC14849 [Drosophila melanogaster]